MDVTAQKLRDVIDDEIAPGIENRRRALILLGKLDQRPGLTEPPSDDDIDDFIWANPLFDDELRQQLWDPGLLGFHSKHAQATEAWFSEFSINVQTWARHPDWLFAHDTFVDEHVAQMFEPADDRSLVVAPGADYSGTLIRSPSLVFATQALLSRGEAIHQLSPDKFEELIAELLQRDGWQVELSGRRGDGGVDVMARRHFGEIGWIKSVWQAKRYDPARSRVGVATVRELHASTKDFGATKGIVATTSILTKGALDYVEQKKYLLDKRDHSDIAAWIMGNDWASKRRV